MTIVTSGLTSGRRVTMATDGFMARTSTTTTITGRMLGESVHFHRNFVQSFFLEGVN